MENSNKVPIDSRDIESATKEVVIFLPGIKAVSRNDTTGHYFNYRRELKKAQTWMRVYGKAKEFHFQGMIDVLIEAYYDCTGRMKPADTPNIDDKIFTDILNRYVLQMQPTMEGRKKIRIEQPVWFIEDDSPTYLRYVTKRAVPSDHFAVRITITEVKTDINNQIDS